MKRIQAILMLLVLITLGGCKALENVHISPLKGHINTHRVKVECTYKGDDITCFMVNNDYYEIPYNKEDIDVGDIVTLEVTNTYEVLRVERGV